jgi:sorbitol-specific phosphotransferase system component IIC
MELLMFYLGAIGVGLIGCVASTALNPFVNKAASILHYLGILITVIYGWKAFSLLDMLGGVLAIFLTGMITSYLFLRLTGRREKK